MRMKPKHQRLLFVGITLLSLCAATLLTLRAFRDNLVFFYSPSEIAARAIPEGQRIRLGGLVEKKSIERDGEFVRFRVTDGQSSVSVEYHGLPPALFREGQGVVAEGYLEGGGHMRASTLLAKHDEYYMPREVVDALKKSGRWREKSQ